MTTSVFIAPAFYSVCGKDEVTGEEKWQEDSSFLMMIRCIKGIRE
jgi:hypothetical protein